jgi:hypothetical protein
MLGGVRHMDYLARPHLSCRNEARHASANDGTVLVRPGSAGARRNRWCSFLPP